MKKLLNASVLLMLLFLQAHLLQAQFLSGTRAIGGGIGYETTTNPGRFIHTSFSDYRRSAFRFHVAAGYMVQDNIEAGLGFGLSSEKEKGTMDGPWNREFESRLSTFSIGPYVRLYNPITDVVGLFGQVGFRAGFGGQSRDSNGVANPEEWKIREFEAGIRPGVILMVNENIGLEAMVGELGYQRHSRGVKDGYDDTKISGSTFRVAFDLSAISFGFRLYLR